MTRRSLHILFLSLAIPCLGLVGALVLRLIHRWNPPECRALVWATATTGFHAVLGLGLWKRAGGPTSPGVAGGLSVVAVRFLSGAALVATGIVANPGAEKVFVSAWTAIFLILFISESIFFVQGVQEL